MVVTVQSLGALVRAKVPQLYRHVGATGYCAQEEGWGVLGERGEGEEVVEKRGISSSYSIPFILLINK